MVNLITRMVIGRLYGDNVESDTFYGDFMVKLVWRLSGIIMEKRGKSNYQTIPILILL